MPTSGSTNFATNRDDLIEGALRLCGVVPEGETPTATQYTTAAKALNMMVKAWEADGMPLWAIKTYSVTPVASSVSYRIGEGQTVNTPKPLKIIQAFFHVGSSNIDIPMRIITRDEYNRLGSKESTGQPIQIYYDVQNTYGDLYTFPIADSTAATAGNYIKIVYQRPFEDFDSSTDEPDFPQEWFEAVKYGLAVRLAGEYQIDSTTRKQLLQEATAIHAVALSFGTEEGSMFIQRDNRSW